VLNSKKRIAICTEVAKALKAQRERRQLSMTALAAKAGLSQQMISFVERGTRNPTLETLVRMSQALDVPLGKIITKAERKG
jgi:transcriptional regulator with XRE-family HTH domain